MASNLERQAAAETKIDTLWRCVFGNGQPGLEAKLSASIGTVRGELRGHIEAVAAHSKKNIEEGDQLVLNEIIEERKARESQHSENRVEQKELGKKVDRLMIIQATMSGALIMFKVLEDFGFIHIAGGK